MMKHYQVIRAKQFGINAYMNLLPFIDNIEERESKQGAHILYITMKLSVHDIAIVYKTRAGRNEAYRTFKEEGENYKRSIKLNYGVGDGRGI